MSQTATKDKTSKKKLLKGLLVILGMILGGLIVGYLIGRMHLIAKPVGEAVYYWSWFPMLIPVFFLVIALHELGHLWAGLLVGFRFQMITVGPFMWTKEAEKINFKWNTSFNTFGGLTVCLPHKREGLMQNFMRYIAGGPLISLFSGILLLSTYYGFGIYQISAGFGFFLISSFWFLTGVFSMVIFLVTAIPMKAQAMYTDGGRFLNLMKGDEKAKIEMLLLSAMSMSAAGIRPRDLNLEDLTYASRSDYRNMFTIYANIYMYYASLDMDKIVEAEAYLLQYERGNDLIPSAFQGLLFLEKAYVEANFHQEVEIAQAYFDRAELNPFIPKHLIGRAKVAIALAAKDYQEAIQQADQALSEIPKAIDKGTALAEKEWIEAMKEKAQTLAEDIS